MANSKNNSKLGGQKTAALAAFGIILASGVGIASLAAWTDTEWVFGAADADTAISTSVFGMQQNTTSGASGWTDEPDSPGGLIAFVDASGLTPGDTAYGFVRLRTIEDSLAGTVTLNASAPDEPGVLYAALTYGAGIVEELGDCSADGFADADVLVPSGTALGATVSPTFDIAEDASAEVIVCFAVTLPEGSSSELQNKSATPIWYFEAESK